MALLIAFGGIFSGGISSAVASLIGFTGLIGGAGRYGAILLGWTPNDIDRATALGFFGGLGAGCLVVLTEATT